MRSAMGEQSIDGGDGQEDEAAIMPTQIRKEGDGKRTTGGSG